MLSAWRGAVRPHGYTFRPIAPMMMRLFKENTISIAMPDTCSLIKTIAAAIAVLGLAMALTLGESRASDFMIAGGCLAYLAILLADWWNKK